MKRLVFVLLSILSIGILSTTSVKAETYEYPFDSIRIISAFQFQVTLDEEPDENSILYGNVSIGETFTVYVGNLEFIFEGAEVQGSGSIMILTDSDNNDFARWLNNSASNSGDFIQYSYGSWIQINPTLGVVKDLSNGQFEIGYKENTETMEYVFFDDLNNTYPMVANSYDAIENLDILISAYEEGN